MDLGKYYDHYFENGGLCPKCNHLLTLHWGCTNLLCEDCQEHIIEEPFFYKRMKIFEEKRFKEIDAYSQLKRRIYERKNIDKCQGKKYADVEYS